MSDLFVSLDNVHNEENEDKGENTEEGNHDEKEEAFLEFLDEIGLKEYFPYKLTMKHVTEIRLFPDDVTHVESTDLPFLFISKLTSLDSTIIWKENLKIDGSVRDFIYAILHCSDHHLRQHLMEKFTACQLAVTILLPGVKEEENTQLLLWALRRIVKKWKENEISTSPEKHMVGEPVFTTSFIRFGDIPISKSSLLSNVLGRAQGNATFRYFLSYEEEREYVYHCCGSVEAQWYLPMYDRKDEVLKEVTLLLNLRGDAHEFPTERNFMCRVANAIFIFVSTSNVYKTEIDYIKKHFPNVCVMYISQQRCVKPRQKRKKQFMKDQVDKKPITSEIKGSIEFNIERGVIELSKIISHRMVQYCEDTNRKYCSIENWDHMCSNGITVDQNNKSYNSAKGLIDKHFLKGDSIANMKRSYLQLQEKWVEWVKVDKKLLYVGKVNIASQFAEKKAKQKEVREMQRRKGLSKDMELFLKNLQTVLFHDTSDTLHYFMTLFQLHIESMVSREIPLVIEKIGTLNASFQKTSTAIQRAFSKDQRRNLERELEQLQIMLLEQSEQFSVINITFEHFIRELGHLYEAHYDDPTVKPRNDLLISVAAKLLLNGYPLEILDGDTAYIPIKWISGILGKVQNDLQNPKIFVLSIIGIQSSGKSTLLNSMFCVRFPVRAGRCTRGLYLQLLQTNVAFLKAFEFEYVLIIDTEGLQSPARTVLNDCTFDNSIATLSMCLADLTLLNIGQETIGPDMIGILQIAVHALIRMKKVKLASNCRIIQQRVSDISAAANNKSNMTNIKHALNKATRIAAIEEKVDHIREFSDVFPLVERDDLQFFPHLWTGLMSPPNYAYSDKVHALKAVIFSSQTKESNLRSHITMEKFISRFNDVWEAVKSEDFVFHFQNSFDALSNQKFRLHHNILIGKMRTEITAWELENGNILSNASSEVFYQNLEMKIKLECEDVNEKIDEYVNGHSEEDEVKRRQQSIKNDTFDIGQDIKRAIIKSTAIILKYKEDAESMPNFITSAKEELTRAAKDTAHRLQKSNPHTDWKQNRPKLQFEFNCLWQEKTNALIDNFSQTKISEKEIEDTCENSLSSLLLRYECSKTYTDVVKERLSPTQKVSQSSSLKHLVGKNSESEIDEIVKGHTNEIEKQKQIKPFQRNHVDTILNAVYNQLKQLKVGNEILVFSLEKIKDRVAEVCKACQVEYERSNSLKTMFDKEKECLRKDFISYFDETIKSEAAIERSYGELMAATEAYILDYVNIELLNEMRRESSYNSKERMIGRILEELCDKKDPKLYYSFINHNEKFLHDWLRTKVLTKITCRASGLIITKIESLVNATEFALRDTKYSFSKQGRDTQISFNAWAQQFYCNENIKYKLNPFSVKDFMLSDIDGFIENFREIIIKNMKNDLREVFSVNTLNKITVASEINSKLQKNVVLEILNHLAVCKELCPFCGVNCHLQITGKHKHKAVLHYSQGVAGYVYTDSEKLVPSICTLLVASNEQYTISEGPPREYRNYMDYAKDYPSWDITPIKGDNPIDYWKWVLETFNDDFAKAYNAKPAEIPEEWGKITQPEALANLRQQYRLGVDY